MNRRQRRKKALIVKANIQRHDMAIERSQEIKAIVKANLSQPISQEDKAWSKTSNAWQSMTTAKSKPAKGDKSLFNPGNSSGAKARFVHTK